MFGVQGSTPQDPHKLLRRPGYSYQTFSLVNLWFDVEKIATETISTGNVS